MVLLREEGENQAAEEEVGGNSTGAFANFQSLHVIYRKYRVSSKWIGALNSYTDELGCKVNKAAR